jgi:DNA-binding transcriptional ArsR family regulator
MLVPSNRDTSNTTVRGRGGAPSRLHPDDARAPLQRAVAEEYASWFQALSDPTRILILAYLARQSEPVAVGQIVEDMQLGQSTVSHHLRTLLQVGFVSRRRERTKQLYHVNSNCITRFPAAADVVMGRAPAFPVSAAASATGEAI